MTPANARHTVKGAIVAVLVGLVVTVGLSEVLLRLVMPQWREFYSARFMQRTTLPGYPRFLIGRPGFDGYFAQNNGDFRHRIRINDFGLRNPGPVDDADGRVWVVGDSMAFGWGVERDQTYTAVIARKLDARTYNVASPGADVCGYQGLLARMPTTVKPRAVIVGLILENDIRNYDCRLKARTDALAPETGDDGIGLPTLSAAKEMLTGTSALYNFVAVTLKRLGAVNDLLIALGLLKREHALMGQFPAVEMAERIAETADELVRLKEGLPASIPFAVLIAPARFEIREGNAFFARLRKEMAAALSARGIDVIDPFPAFKAAGFGPTHFAHDGHWSPAGHEIAGTAAAAWLKPRLGAN